MKKPVLLSFLAGTVRPAPGQVSPGLALALLLHDEGRESSIVIQLPHAKVWDLQDACSEVPVFFYSRYIAFMGKSQSLASRPEDAYLSSLPPSDDFAVFYRRQKELALPQAYLTGLQPSATAAIRDAASKIPGTTHFLEK